MFDIINKTNIIYYLSKHQGWIVVCSSHKRFPMLESSQWEQNRLRVGSCPQGADVICPCLFIYLYGSSEHCSGLACNSVHCRNTMKMISSKSHTCQFCNVNHRPLYCHIGERENRRQRQTDVITIFSICKFCAILFHQRPQGCAQGMISCGLLSFTLAANKNQVTISSYPGKQKGRCLPAVPKVSFMVMLHLWVFYGLGKGA